MKNYWNVLEFLKLLKRHHLTDFCPSGDCWARFPGDLPPAFQEQPRSPDGRPAQHLPQAHQVPRHLPNQQQVDDDDDDDDDDDYDDGDYDDDDRDEVEEEDNGHDVVTEHLLLQ